MFVCTLLLPTLNPIYEHRNIFSNAAETKANKLWKNLLKWNFIRRPLSSLSSKVTSLCFFLFLLRPVRSKRKKIRKRIFPFRLFFQSNIIFHVRSFQCRHFHWEKLCGGDEKREKKISSQRGKVLRVKTIIDNSETRKSLRVCYKLKKRIILFLLSLLSIMEFFFTLHFVFLVYLNRKLLNIQKLYAKAYVFPTLIFLGNVWFFSSCDEETIFEG